MGTDDAASGVANIRYFKVHHLMCTELMQLVDRISRIFPKIEEARPRCGSGIQALCSLNKAIDKANLILQYCAESSKLYLAVTGEVLLSRCIKSSSLLKQSLSQIQDMVPVILAAEISQIIDDLSAATFHLDPYEEAAGKVVRELLQNDSSASDSSETSQAKTFQLATSMLHLTSPKAILIEKRSIKKLMEKVGENDPTKKKILTYFVYLFKKYGNSVVVDQPDGTPSRFENPGIGSYNAESHARLELYEAENNLLRRSMPPDEFRCPISSRLMYDPVVVASGQTYERMWIQKWLDEGNGTCPKTGKKLVHFSLTPNLNMKDLISKWCAENEVVIPDPRVGLQTRRSWDTSVTSVASFGSSMNDLHLQMDFSDVSFGSIDTSFTSDFSRTKAVNGFGSPLNDYHTDEFQTYPAIPESHTEFLSKLGEHTWESRCKVVEDVKNTLTCNERACFSLTSENFIEPLIGFLRNARDLNATNAQRDGIQLLLTFASKNRNEIPYLREDAFDLLASLLDSELAEQAFSVVEVLSGYSYCRSKITASGALASIVRALDSESKILREQALKILHNLSSNNDICREIVSSECIARLVPLIKKVDFTRSCLSVMKNLSHNQEGRDCIAETRGCVASITEVLDIGGLEEQEFAVDILLSLCSQRVEYCHLAMNEGIIPPLVIISVNGNERAKAGALELLRQLRDTFEPEPPLVVDLNASRPSTSQTQENKPSKSSGFFGRRIFGRKR